MNKEDLEELKIFSHELADCAREILSEKYRSSFSVRQKADKSAVTEIDEQVEKALSEKIKERFPDHGILGEEFGVTDCNSDYKWIIDPIDGTASFLIGRPLFCVLIALQYQGKIVLGIVEQPVTKERWVGVNGGATHYNDSPVKVRDCKQISEAVLCTTSEEYFNQEQLKLFHTIRSQAAYCVYGGDAYNYALLSRGHIDLVIEAGLKPYDYAALVPVIEGAGGIITDWSGNALDGVSVANVIACADPELHKKLLEYLS
jgi:histidinol phosphatase-like enzyme (inositol monophosphatase family)